MATERFSCKRATSAADIKACGDIRVEVFVDEQGFPADTEFDDVDENGTGVHFLVTDTSTDTPAGTIRLVPSRGKLTRLAVRKAYRAFGLGRVLVHALEEYAAAHSEEMKYVREVDGKRVVTVKIHSQIPVVKFYGKLGYEVRGDEFDEEGEPHLLMQRDIEATS